MATSVQSAPVRLAIVSPCSKCKNQQATASGTTPVCPRREVQTLITRLQDNGGDPSALEHLALYGTEGSSSEGDGSFRNPVYWDDGHAIMVWVALLEENRGVYDGTGKLICPDILNPGFDTTYIQCRDLPIIPRDHEAAYFQSGGFAENDQLEVTLSADQQMSSSTTGTPVLVGGFGRKVNFLFNNPRTPVAKDLCPAGT